MYNREAFDAYLSQHHDRFIDEFAQFIAVPSVAADGRGIQPMADLLSERFKKLGARVTQYPLPGGSPVVYAELDGNSDTTMLIYNHYDVQPEVPVDLWNSDPFTLTIKDGVMYGRGTSDDKGELLSRIQAIEAWLQTQGSLPCNIKWVAEGEEEIASINLPAWAEAHRDMLKADGVLWEGGGYDTLGRPTMAAGCKGIAYFELRAQGAKMDLHSSIAPRVVNPAWRLVWALSTLKDPQDRITIDGYMDQVAPVSAELKAKIDALPTDGFATELEMMGLTHWLNGMDDRTAQLRSFTEPTVTICGIETGYTGKGSKTVLPAHAYAKVDCRLVPNLTVATAQKLIREHLDRRGFNDIEVRLIGGEEPADSPMDTRIQRAAVQACNDTFGKQPLVYPRFAGSGPMYPLSTMLNIPVISAGATWHPNSRAHSPNENILLKDYIDSMRFTAALLSNFGG